MSAAQLILQSLHVALVTPPAERGPGWAAFEDRARVIIAYGLAGRADLIESGIAGLGAQYMAAVTAAPLAHAPRVAGTNQTVGVVKDGETPPPGILPPAEGPAAPAKPAAAPAPQPPKGQPPGKARR